MASTIYYPEKVRLTGNFINFGFTANQYSVNGVANISELQFLDSVQNDTLTISFGNKELSFTFKNYPNDSGLQLTNKNGMPDADWAVILLGELKANKTLYDNYEITQQGSLPIFYLTAKNVGTDYTIGVTTTASVFHTIDQAAVDAVLNSFFKVGIQVLRHDNNEILGEALKPVNDNSRVYFDISSYADEELSNELTYPHSSTTRISEQDNACLGFYLRYFERYGSPPTAKQVSKTSVYYAIKGGIPKALYAAYKVQGTNFHTKLTFSKSFLTRAPKTKIIPEDSYESLFYLNFSGATSLKIQTKIYFSDGTSNTHTRGTLTGTEQYKVYEMHISPRKFLDGVPSISIPAGEVISQYDVQVLNQDDNIISETRRYIIDQSSHENSQFIIFKNSLSGYDTIRLTGIKTYKPKLDRINFFKFLDYDMTNEDFEKGQTRATANHSYEVNTGFIKLNYEDNIKEAAKYYLDLFLSEEIYVFKENILIRAIIDSNSVEIYTDNNYNYFIKFKYSETYEDKYINSDFDKLTFGSGFGSGFETPSLTSF